MCEQELFDLQAEISRNVVFEMKFKLTPQCDKIQLKLIVRNLLGKYLKS